MSKKQQTNETLDNTFEGFKLLDQNVAAIKDDELSEEELAQLDNAANNNTSTKGSNEPLDNEDKNKQTNKTSDNKGKTSVSNESEEEEEESTESHQKKDDNKGASKSVETEDESSPYEAYAKYMSEKGLLDLDDEDKVETEEDLEKIQEKTISKRVDKWKEKLPEDAQKFLEFVENGGNPQDFHKYYYNDASFESFNIESEENQKHVIKESLKLEGYSDEEIEDEITLYEDGGKLESRAKTHLNKLRKLEKEQKEALVEAQKEFSKQQEKKRQEEWDNFKKGLFDREAIGGFKLTGKTKNDLWDYMTKVSDKKTGRTQYQIDSESNEDARYVFAYLLKNKWDVKSLERMVESKVTGKLHSKLSNFTDTRQKIAKTAKSDIEKQLEDSPFAGFSKLL